MDEKKVTFKDVSITGKQFIKTMAEETPTDKVIQLCVNFAEMNGVLKSLVKSVDEIKDSIKGIVNDTTAQIGKLETKYELLESTASANKVNIAVLQTKAGIIGSVGGFVSGILGAAIVSVISYYIANPH